MTTKSRRSLTPLLLAALTFSCSHAHAADAPKPTDASQAFKAKLQATMSRHLSQLIGKDGSVPSLKGKSADGSGALAFYLMFEATGEQKFRKAAVGMADQILKDMRATKFGVLAIKEKDKPDGKTIIGGGPPALGAYTAAAAYILHQEGERNDDLKYIATVLDRFPWNEQGWWASTIDVATGESKVPMTKPGIINKSAAIAMAAGILSGYVRDLDPELSARLKHKTDKCIYSQIIPAQGADGYWHYSLSENDPKNKDVLGYFMLTTGELMHLQKFNPAYREPRMNAAVQKAQAFALKCIAPMTDPNHGSACAEHRTPSTPAHYSVSDDLKRSFQLGHVLIGGGHIDEGIKIMNAALDRFPVGNGGMDGVNAAEPSALILSGF
ncbi:MAG: hypothetical protein HY301_14995 [Verrucomicrobia bacterium]|nr:hypothetical protein [Verrucomicrobiota bacterium]